MFHRHLAILVTIATLVAPAASYAQRVPKPAPAPHPAAAPHPRGGALDVLVPIAILALIAGAFARKH